jgi:preprotein translocase subunit SecF
MDFVRYRFWFIAFSLLLTALGVAAMFIPPAFRIGIEFAGGSAITLEFPPEVQARLNQTALREVLGGIGHADAVIQKVGETGYLVRTRTLAETQKDANGVITRLSDRELLEAALTRQYGPGQTELRLKFATAVDQAKLQEKMTELGFPDVAITRVSDVEYTIRTRELSFGTVAVQPSQSGEQPALQAQDSEVDKIVSKLSTEVAQVTSSDANPVRPWTAFDLSFVSPTIAQETIRNAIIAVVVASLFILLYIWFAFRGVQGAFILGAAAIIAALHDTFITLGIFSLLGKFMDAEINAMFITGMLTVVGYSVHDSIVVFDRIRENIKRFPSRSLETNVNFALSETIGRSLNTGITTLIVIIALLLLGGPTIRSFLLTLLVGITVGTYSSIFIASQLLVIWRRKEWLGPFSRKGTGRSASPAPTTTSS